MSETTRPCDYCGFPNPLTARVCEACGQPVRAAAQEPTLMVPRPPVEQPKDIKDLEEWTQPEGAEPAGEPAVQAAPPPPAPEPVEAPKISGYPMVTPQVPKKKNRTGLIVALILLGGMVCLLAVAVGGFFLVRNVVTRSQPTLESIINSVETEIPALVEEGTFMPLPLEATVESLEPLATKMPELNIPIPDLGGQTAPSAGQFVSDSYFYDDLSNNDMGWSEPPADDISEHKWEDGAYSILVKKPEYVAWTDVPVDFNPIGAEFDVWVPAGGQGGSFGLICHKQSDEDYYYVEMDISDQTYSIGRYLNGDYQALTSPDWSYTDKLLTGSQVNRIWVACESDMIMLLINTKFVAQVNLLEQASPGEMAIFGSTWEDMPAGGYKVFFDNFNAWKSVQ